MKAPAERVRELAALIDCLCAEAAGDGHAGVCVPGEGTNLAREELERRIAAAIQEAEADVRSAVVQRLDVRPGDAVVLQFAQWLPPEAKRSIVAQWKALDLGRAIVLDGGATVAAVIAPVQPVQPVPTQAEGVGEG